MGNNYQNNKPKQNHFLPKGYLEGGYFLDSAKEKMKKEYVTNYAREIAKTLGEEGGRQKNKRAQIRKFYEYGLRVAAKLQEKNNDFSCVDADVAAFIPKATYAKNRDVVTEMFEKFIVENIQNTVKDAKDYRAFMKHFEAIIAYMKND